VFLEPKQQKQYLQRQNIQQQLYTIDCSKGTLHLQTATMY